MPRSKANGNVEKETERTAAIRTFDEFCADYNLSTEERTALVRRLALLRYEKTLQALLTHHTPPGPILPALPNQGAMV